MCFRFLFETNCLYVTQSNFWFTEQFANHIVWIKSAFQTISKAWIGCNALHNAAAALHTDQSISSHAHLTVADSRQQEHWKHPFCLLNVASRGSQTPLYLATSASCPPHPSKINAVTVSAKGEAILKCVFAPPDKEIWLPRRWHCSRTLTWRVMSSRGGGIIWNISLAL